MKFKGILSDQLCMKDFFNIVSTFARLSKRAVFNIRKSGLCISNVGIGINANSIAWSQIESKNFFAHFNMKGVDESYDEIWLTLYPEQLATALNTVKTHFVKVIVLKLTNKQFPCISVDIEMAPQNSNNYRRLVHDLPVSIIPVREWNEYHQPVLKNFDISIQMPSLKSLRTLCDKMKNLAATITICCISSGDLSFIVETDSAIVVSRYFNLILDQMNEDNSNMVEDGQSREICCNIDTKQLSMCFGSIQLPSTLQIFGNMIQDELFNIKIKVRDNVSLFFNIQCVDAT
ncbi:checkpoint protein HUS1 [Sitodiplosis mosellana]|uniref:checkpoint protein HUS1 n=1 Tax=Sitodiplosis mosellana TaxID=263140 RepID=UPI0024448F87|nr:checkpoint protein HUS1 [Sitodiplosis mosellana]